MDILNLVAKPNFLNLDGLAHIVHTLYITKTGVLHFAIRNNKSNHALYIFASTLY